MTSEVDQIDAINVKAAVRRTYAALARDPTGEFTFRRGRAWARELGYPQTLLDRVPDIAADSFAGVANPFSLGPIHPGERVLDVGCGSGLDTLIAAHMAGPTGHVSGIDMTEAMLANANRAIFAAGATHVALRPAHAEELPFRDQAFDVVISNGVIDLVPDKDAVFAEVYRTLRPGGRIQFADITIRTPVTDEARRNIDLWAGWIAGALQFAEYAGRLDRHGFAHVETREASDGFSAASEQAQQAAHRFGARGTLITAIKPSQ